MSVIEYRDMNIEVLLAVLNKCLGKKGCGGVAGAFCGGVAGAFDNLFLFQGRCA